MNVQTRRRVLAACVLVVASVAMPCRSSLAQEVSPETIEALRNPPPSKQIPPVVKAELQESLTAVVLPIFRAAFGAEAKPLCGCYTQEKKVGAQVEREWTFFASQSTSYVKMPPLGPMGAWNLKDHPGKSVSIHFVYREGRAGNPQDYGLTFRPQKEEYISSNFGMEEGKMVDSTISLIDFQNKKAALRHCFEQRSKRLSWLEGDTLFRVELNDPGKVVDVMPLAQAVQAAVAGSGVLDFPRKLVGRKAEKPFFDAAPLLAGLAERRNPTPADLARLTDARVGTVADGVSHLFFKARCAGPGSFTVSTGDADGTVVCALDPAKSTGTVQEEKPKEFYAYGLYRAPEEFGQAAQGGRLNAESQSVHYRDVNVIVAFKPAQGPETTATLTLKLARPPVVLVHGTFDSPEKCWRTASPEKSPDSMEGRLKKEGFGVFCADFQDTNGCANESWLEGSRPTKGSRFQDNARVVWANPGGIQEALEFYRRKLGLAATRADVVGHSMGGVLPRVYASEAYNTIYRRGENGLEGDIRRLITLGSTHHGSDLAGLAEAAKGLSRDQLTAWESVVRHGMLSVANLAVGINNGALSDQEPGSDALKRIGATRIPCYALAFRTLEEDLDHFNGEFRKGFEIICTVFAWCPGLLEKIFTQRLKRPEEAELVLDKILALNQDTESWLGNMPKFKRDEKMAELVKAFRAGVFRQAPNDTTVRLESARGGLPDANVKVFDNVIHSYATRYRAVQDKVVELLKGSKSLFCEAGFLPAGKDLTDPEVAPYGLTKAEAINASNLVPGHAEAFLKVAKARDLILITRPVNPSATQLIEMNLATKAMEVKGKSSDWGPQNGFIAVDQRFSKIWKEADKAKRAHDLEKYNAEVIESIKKKDAKPVPLSIRYENVEYRVYFVKNSEEPIPILQDPDQNFYTWDDPNRRPLRTAEDYSDRLRRLLILADPDSKIPLSADYDLLEIGYKTDPGKPIYRKRYGFVTDDQIRLIDQLNQAVKESGYTAGRVVHHGPEMQFDKSPGVDYPNTAFQPDGKIIHLKQGPTGRKDLFLKQYMHRMKLLGWTHFEPNPRWNWGPYNPASGWNPQDGEKPK